MTFNNHPILRQVLGRVHVGVSNLQAVRTCIKALKGRYKTFLGLKRSEKRSFIKAVVKMHGQNRDLYRTVMGGRI